MSTIGSLARSLETALKNGAEHSALLNLILEPEISAEEALQAIENAAHSSGFFPQLRETALQLCQRNEDLPEHVELALGNLAYGAHDFDAAVEHYSRCLFIQGKKVQALEGLKAVQTVRDLRHFLRTPVQPSEKKPAEETTVPVLKNGLRREVYLTIDDGPNPDSTPALLDLLHRFDQKATFFFTGKGAELYPDLVRQASDQGHGVFGHSYTHQVVYTQLSHQDCLNDILKTESILTGLRGKPEKLIYRFPGGMGHFDANLLGFLSNALPDLELAHWTTTCQDGRLYQRWSAAKSPKLELLASLAQLLKNVSGGREIILAHEIPFNETNKNDHGRMIEAFFGMMLMALDEAAIMSRRMG